MKQELYLFYSRKITFADSFTFLPYLKITTMGEKGTDNQWKMYLHVHETQNRITKTTFSYNELKDHWGYVEMAKNLVKRTKRPLGLRRDGEKLWRYGCRTKKKRADLHKIIR